MLVSNKKKIDRVTKMYEEALKEKADQHKTLLDKHTDLETKYHALKDELESKYREEKALAFKTMELDFKQKQLEEVQKIKDEYDNRMRLGLEENFAKLKDELASLHREGNANTKHLEQMTYKMMDAFGKTGGRLLGNPSRED